MCRYIKFLLLPLSLVFIFVLPRHLWAQQVFSRVEYSFQGKTATDAPEIGKLPKIEYPKDAFKNGVEGKLIAVNANLHPNI